MTGEERPAVKAKPRVEKNRVLVTGGAGFVGSHLCDFLVARGDHVSCPGLARGCLSVVPPLALHLLMYALASLQRCTVPPACMPL
jgi:GDP-D-mannose dehydratase